MFDVAFSEIIVIAVVALIVIGPERLPKVARTLGMLTGRLQRYVSSVKADIERELRVEELRRIGQDAGNSIRAVESSVRSQVAQTEAELNTALTPPDEKPVEAQPATEKAPAVSKPHE